MQGFGLQPGRQEGECPKGLGGFRGNPELLLEGFQDYGNFSKKEPVRTLGICRDYGNDGVSFRDHIGAIQRNSHMWG